MDVLIWLKNHLSLSYSFKSLVKKKNAPVIRV